jgi:hypothetical protein
MMGFRVSVVVGNFSLFTTAFGPALVPTQPPIQRVPGALTLGIKRQGHGADYSSPSSSEIKNVWSYTSTPNTPSWLPLPKYLIHIHRVPVALSAGVKRPGPEAYHLPSSSAEFKNGWSHTSNLSYISWQGHLL